MALSVVVDKPDEKTGQGCWAIAMQGHGSEIRGAKGGALQLKLQKKVNPPGHALGNPSPKKLGSLVSSKTYR